ncbi:hypothetical protein FJT64_014329 [Amphibalanus amphitrite]|uniref:G-protein coupled receptors family 1 profile domain-containing protein n=1 Tax=Amphibalanus amphitrite TaxID=1232801 RepID=A0A6A4VBZ3_AMPAM|nr:hypothetical protein FJT64_014329 [Amphibalanus amphitrite]
MSNVTIVRISGGPESLPAGVGPTPARAPSPRSESGDASLVTFASGRVTLKVDGSGSPDLPRRPQRTRRRTQLVHHRDRHLRQEAKVVRYLPSPKAAPLPRRSSSTSDAATCTSTSDIEADADASPAPSSAASSYSERSGVESVPPPPTGLHYRLSLAEQYQNQLFAEPSYVISAPAAFAGDWATSSDAHDSGLEGSESEATPRSNRESCAKAAARDRAREPQRSDDVTDGGSERASDVTDGGSERVAVSEQSESRAERAGERCGASDGGDSEACAAAATEEDSGESFTVISEESGYCYIPAKEQRECSQEFLIVVSERVSPADFVSSEEEQEEELAVPESPTATRKVSAATTVDKHFYFGEEVERASSEGGSSQGDCPPPELEVPSALTVHNVRRLEELQARSALPDSFLAFKQALLESGDMSGLRKADLYTVLGGTVRGYPASWDDLGSKFEEPDNRSEEPPAPDTDSRSGVSIDAWTVDRRGTDGVRPTSDSVYHVACLRCASCERALDREEVHAAGRLLFCGLHAPAEATVCQPGHRVGSRHGSCASSVDGQQEGALSVPYYISFYFDVSYRCEEGPCLARYFVTNATNTMSILLLVVVSVDRFVAVKLPLRYPALMSRRRALSAATTGLYVGIFREAWRQNRMAREVAGPGPRCHRPSGDTKTACMMVLILGCNTVAMLPYALGVCLRYAYIENIYIHENVLSELKKVNQMFVSLYFAKSAINPVVYGWKNAEFAAAFRQIVGCGDRSKLRRHSSQRHLHSIWATADATWIHVNELSSSASVETIDTYL